MSVPTLDTFTTAYLECALWSSTGDDGEPLDRDYSLEDIDGGTLTKMIADCGAFQTAHAEDIADNVAQAGHDFWLTRCGHGAGFWDGDWPEPAATRLTEASHQAGNVDLYVGDDGKVYAS